MVHEYDLFEKFPDGSSLWRASVLGLESARIHLQELSRKSNNQHFAIDMVAGRTFHLNPEQDALGFLVPKKGKRRNIERVA